MSSLMDHIEAQSRSHLAEDRAKLAESLLESLRPFIGEIEAAWSDEIAARIAAFEHGDVPPYAAEQVFAEARHLLQ